MHDPVLQAGAKGRDATGPRVREQLQAALERELKTEAIAGRPDSGESGIPTFGDGPGVATFGDGPGVATFGDGPGVATFGDGAPGIVQTLGASGA